MVASFFQQLHSVLLLQNAALVVLLLCCRSCDGLNSWFLDPVVRFLAASLLFACFCGEEQEDLNACITWRELDYFSLEEQTFCRGLKLSVAVRLSQDCLCHSLIQIMMKQLVFLHLAESWIAFICMVKLLSISKVSFLSFFSSLDMLLWFLGICK